MATNNLLPFRYFKSAIAITAVVLVLFWVAGYPVDDWAAGAVILFALLHLFSMLFRWAVAFCAKQLVNYGRKVLAKYGVNAPVQQTEERPAVWTRPLIGLVGVGFVTALAYGVGLLAGFYAFGRLGLEPLPSAFVWIAATALIIGAIGATAMLGFPALVFVTADLRRQSAGDQASRLYPMIERLSQTRLRRA